MVSMMMAKTENSIVGSMQDTPPLAERMSQNRGSKYIGFCESYILNRTAVSRHAFSFVCFLAVVCCLLASPCRAEPAAAPRDAQTKEIAPASLTPQTSAGARSAAVRLRAEMPSVEPDAEKASQNGLYGAPMSSSQVARRLWQSSLSFPEDQNDIKAKNELKYLIEKIRSVRFEFDKQTPEHIIATTPRSKTEPNEALSSVETPKQPEKKDMQIKPDKSTAGEPYEPVSEQTLQILANLSQHPDQLHNPLGLADVLFLSGHPKQAAMFYQQALSRIGFDNIGPAEDRAWILFQRGNCLRGDDLTNAGKMYRQLITEYPNSPWTDLAKARLNLIDWYQKNEPQALIAKCKEHPGGAQN
jgi:hypothetical protein